MIQQQRNGGSLATTAVNVAKQHGFRNGVFRGFLATVARDSIYVGGYVHAGVLVCVHTCMCISVCVCVCVCVCACVCV
jgi:hypothetical protein